MSPHPPSDNNPLQREARMMHLEELLREREYVPTCEFPVPTPELLSRFERLYSGAVCDALRELCLLDQALPGYLRPLSEDHVVAGIAFTVKSAPNIQISGEMTFRTKMLDAMPKDGFVVWDTSGDQDATLWGGVMTAAAVSKGVRAACIDGGIRDTRQILDRKFPVYYKYRLPNGSLGRCLITHYQIPIKVGNVIIRPGDVIFADIDGVLCIPRDVAYKVLVRAEEFRSNETKIFGWVAEGKTVTQITKSGGYF